MMEQEFICESDTIQVHAGGTVPGSKVHRPCPLCGCISTNSPPMPYWPGAPQMGNWPANPTDRKAVTTVTTTLPSLPLPILDTYSPNPQIHPSNRLPSTPYHASTPTSSIPAEQPPFYKQETFCTIVDSNQPLNAQLNVKFDRGFFFSNDRVWSCYRRNNFAMDASCIIGALSPETFILNDLRITSPELETKVIEGFSLRLRAEVIEGRPVELVQYTPKRGKNSSAPVPTFDLSQENASKPATSINLSGTWERMRFKLATENNGKRQSIQQYFYVIVELFAESRDIEAKSVYTCVARKKSHPLVVRGRSPKIR